MKTLVDLDSMPEADRTALLASGLIDQPRQRAAEAGRATRERRRGVGRYGNVAHPTIYNGVRYDSKAEANHAVLLDLRIKEGAVAWWLRQVKIPLGPDFSTRVDFLVCEWVEGFYGLEHRWISAHEVKGVETREFAKVRSLWPKYGPFPLHIIKRGEVEIIERA